MSILKRTIQRLTPSTCNRRSASTSTTTSLSTQSSAHSPTPLHPNVAAERDYYLEVYLPSRRAAVHYTPGETPTGCMPYYFDKGETTFPNPDWTFPPRPSSPIPPVAPQTDTPTPSDASTSPLTAHTTAEDSSFGHAFRPASPPPPYDGASRFPPLDQEDLAPEESASPTATPHLRDAMGPCHARTVLQSLADRNANLVPADVRAELEMQRPRAGTVGTTRTGSLRRSGQSSGESIGAMLRRRTTLTMSTVGRRGGKGVVDRVRGFSGARAGVGGEGEVKVTPSLLVVVPRVEGLFEGSEGVLRVPTGNEGGV